MVFGPPRGEHRLCDVHLRSIGKVKPCLAKTRHEFLINDDGWGHLKDHLVTRAARHVQKPKACDGCPGQELLSARRD
jgi:hypothetical protein